MPFATDSTAMMVKATKLLTLNGIAWTKERFGPLHFSAAALDALNKQQRDRLEGEDPLAAEQYNEGVHGRYDDFFVIANEQYDQPKEEDRFNNYFAN